MKNTKSPDLNPIYGRAIALMVLLFVLKLWLLIQNREDLFQEHWRIVRRGLNWTDFLAYGLFLLLVGAISFIVGKSLSNSKPKHVRLLFVFSFLGAIFFVFSSFHVMEKNYIQPVVDGTLKWWQVGHYLIMDLFFAPPFLAIYLGGGAVLYWIFLRTNREWWMFPVLGASSIVYLLLNIRNPFDYGSNLLLADCVGVAGLLGWYLARQPLSISWQFVSVLPGFLTLAWFNFHDSGTWKMEPCLIIFLCASLGLMLVGNLLSRETEVRRAVSFFLPFWSLLFFLLCSHDYPLAANINNALRCGIVSPCYLEQEYLIILGLLATTFLIHRKKPIAAQIFFDVIAWCMIMVALVDVLVSRAMGFRLDWNVVAISDDPVLIWRTIRPQITPLLAGIAMCAAVYRIMARICSRAVQNRIGPSMPKLRGTAVYFLSFACFVFLVGRHVVEDDKCKDSAFKNLLVTSPLMDLIEADSFSPEEFKAMAKKMEIGKAAQDSKEKLKGVSHPADLNVVLVILESSYNRYLSLFGASDETEPLLKQYRDRMELFPNFYSNYPSSLNARFSVLGGMYACKPFVTYVNPRVGSIDLFDIFHKQGYWVSLFYSSFQTYERWGDYLRFHSIDSLYDASNMPGRENGEKVSWGLKEDVTLEAMKNQFAIHATNHTKFFLTYVPAAPHMPFDTDVKRFEKFDNGFPNLTKDYSGRYKNQLLYIDWVLASILDELGRLKLLDKTLVVITDDHGEMVGENHDHLGHGWNVEPRLCNVPLIILDPRKQGARVNPVLGSQVDILPTILDLMGMAVPSGELYQGVSLYSESALSDRPVYISSYLQRAVIRRNIYSLEEVPPGQTQSKVTRAYTISHSGAKTEFEPTKASDPISDEMNRFDRFQKELISRYPHWKDVYNKSEGTYKDRESKRQDD